MYNSEKDNQDLVLESPEYIYLGEVEFNPPQNVLSHYPGWDYRLKEWVDRWQYPGMRLKVALNLYLNNKGYTHIKIRSYPLTFKDGAWNLKEVIETFKTLNMGEFVYKISPVVSRRQNENGPGQTQEQTLRLLSQKHARANARSLASLARKKRQAEACLV